MDALKDYLAPKTFGILAYVCSIVQILCGVVFTGITVALKEGEAEKFTCYVPHESTLIYKTQVDKACFSKYQQHYNAPLRFYTFVLLSTWFPVMIALVYSLLVRRRVDQVDSTVNETQADGEPNNQVRNRTFYVFRFYFIHLAIRVLCGVLFTILQHVLLFPRGFDFKFGCSLPSTELPTKIPKSTSVSQLNNTTSIACENTSDKHTLSVIISLFNCGFAFIIFAEIIRLCRRFPICKYVTRRECDTGFIVVYLLRKEYMREEIELTSVSSNLRQASVSSNSQQESFSSNLRQRSVSSKLRQRSLSSNLQPESVSLNLQQCVDYYKRQVLRSPRSTGLNLGTKSKDDFDELYINLVIHTERAPHKFSKYMERHEIYDVYMEVPPDSVCLKEVKDLFYPNKDTKEKCPRKILVVGRPGIGKTVLTEKIIRDWASGADKFYNDKIAFYFKFRWFNAWFNGTKDMTLKRFLCYGTELSDQIFDKIYKEITKHPEKAILIFDGLDEFNGNFECVDDLSSSNDPDISMSGILLFSKLISGRLLSEATVVVTSRPTANEFYSEFNFDSTVEIIGFTKERIEEYVIKFCQSQGRDHLKHKIWNHIKSSSELLHLCYIPVNCWIVCTILFESLKDPRNATVALPTTVTELYQAAVDCLGKKHFRKLNRQSSEKATRKKLQQLAFESIEPMQLIFHNELFDEQTKQSGLLNSLSNPYSQAQTQFCFIHLTIQEFLAAGHVIEMFSVKQIKKFIFSNIDSSKWHLVLQFIAGLLGKEIKMFQKDRYKDCVFAFAKSFELRYCDGVFRVREDYTSLLIMKCLREVEDEEIVKEACKTTAINGIIGLRYGIGPVMLTSSDWSAVFFVCKHMKNLTKLDMVPGFVAYLSQECYLEVLRLLQQRCVEELMLGGRPSGTTENLFKTLIESKCSLNHEHSKLIKLDISYHNVTHEVLSIMCEFFRNGHAICLKELRLAKCEISSRKLYIFCEVLDKKLCPELTCLNLGDNSIAGEGLTKLCKVLTKQKLLKLTELNLQSCSLTIECVPALCELLRNECCNLIDLTLGSNPGINDDGLRIFCKDALTNEHCKLERLDLKGCSLTDDCLPELCNALQHEHCRLNELYLVGNKFTEEGKKSILEIPTHEHGLYIDVYSWQ